MVHFVVSVIRGLNSIAIFDSWFFLQLYIFGICDSQLKQILNSDSQFGEGSNFLCNTGHTYMIHRILDVYQFYRHSLL